MESDKFDQLRLNFLRLDHYCTFSNVVRLLHMAAEAVFDCLRGKNRAELCDWNCENINELILS